MNGLIPLPAALPGQVVAIDGAGDILVFVRPHFVPSFQLIKRRYNGVAGRASELAHSLRPTAGHALLELAGVERASLLAPAEDDWRRQLRGELTRSWLKVYRFGSHEQPLLSAQTTLLADMRSANRAFDGGGRPSGDALRVAIAAELSRQLANRTARQEAWDRVFHEEPWYQQSLIVAGAALTGLHDVLKGLADIAVLAVDLAGAAAHLTFTLSENLLRGQLDQVEALIQRLGGRLQGGIDGARRLLREAERTLRLLFADRSIGEMLVEYLAGWVAATPITERVRGTVRIGGEVLLALGLAVLSGGAGAAALAGNASRQIGMFSERLLHLLAEAARWLGRRSAGAGAEVVPESQVRGLFPSELVEHAKRPRAEGAEGNSQRLGPVLANRVGTEKPLPATLSETETRKWYHAQEDLIPLKIDKSQSVREQALQAFRLRNEIRRGARELMSNKALAAELDVTDPNLTLDQIVRRKYQVKGLAGESLWADILKSSTESRPSIDKSLGLTRKR